MSTDVYQQLETRIRNSELTEQQARLAGLMLRWEFGKQLLAERGDAGRLPNGRLEELANALGISRAEVGNRMRFAKYCETEADVQTALKVYGSWFGICRDSMKARLTDDEPDAPDEPNTPELESKRLLDAVLTLRTKADGSLLDGCEHPLLAMVLRDRRYLDRWDVKPVFEAFVKLRNRLTVCIEALAQRMDAKTDTRLDSLSGHTLMDLIHTGEKVSSVGESETCHR